MIKHRYYYYILKAIIFRGLLFFPFGFLGFLNFMPLFVIRKKGIKRIVFQAYNPQIAQVFLPIIDELRKNREIEIWFIVMFHPYHGVKGLKKTRAFVQKTLGIDKNRTLNIWEAHWQKFDALICSDVYAKFPLLKTKKILLPHGAGLLSRWVTKSLLRKTVNDFDYYLLCGNFDLLQIKESVGNKTQLLKTGFPFVDNLVYDLGKNTSPIDLPAAMKRKIVLYAPSWGHTYKYGDILSRNIKNVMECLTQKDVFVLLKLHAASYVAAQAKGVSWKKEIQAYENCDNVRIIHDLSDIPYLKLADILISDISSRSFNFMITDKPVIVYGVPDHFSRTRIEKMRLKKILAGAYVADTCEELSNVLDTCLQYPDAMAQERQKVVKDVFANIGTAGLKTADQIKQIVETHI